MHGKQGNAAGRISTQSDYVHPRLLTTGFMEEGFRLQGEGFRLQTSGFRLQTSGGRLQGEGFRLQASGFWGKTSGFRGKAKEKAALGAYL
jgi:hypothetical protein